MATDELDPKAFSNSEPAKQVEKNLLANTSLVSGVNNNSSEEINPKLEKTENEKIIQGQTNCFIILGKDRTSTKGSGFGGIGATGAAAIDIVVGLMGARPIGGGAWSEVENNKDFKNDAARIYISQMADIDDYFGIPKIAAEIDGVEIDLEHPKATASIAAKADNIRVIAREGIKLVTFHKGVNQLSKKGTDCGVDIIAGCNVLGADPFLDLQPMVKGDNLLEILKLLVQRLEDVQANLSNFMKTQKELNDIFSMHTHQSSAPGGPTSPIVGFEQHAKGFELLTKVLPNFIFNMANLAKIDGDYFAATNPKYINSIFNRVN